MKGISPLLSIAWISSLFLTSCGDDPELIAKRDKQKAEISRLSSELSLIESQLENLPPDVSKELSEAREKTEANKQLLTELETEIASLTSKKQALQTEFDSYRGKYPVK